MPPSGRIDQSTGAGAGVAGNAREGLWLNQALSLVDVGGSPVSRLWTLVDRPPGSAATIINPTLATASIANPDVPGSYLYRLQWNNDPKLIFERVFRVTLSNAGIAIPNFFPLPAAGEDGFHSNGIAGQGTGPGGRGWSPVMEAWKAYVDQPASEDVQLLNYGTPLTIDAAAGHTVRVGALTGNLTINAPINLVDGQELSIETVQDGTGGRSITWNAIFQQTDGMGYNDRRAGIRTIHRFKYNATLALLVAIERVLDPASKGVVEFSAGPAALVPGLINVLRSGANTATVPAKSTGWGGARNTITVKNDNLSAPPAVLSPTGGDTLNGGATFNVANAYGQAAIFFEDDALTSNTILCSPG